MASFSKIVEEARLSGRALRDYGDNLFNPTVRLGVTGLSRAGKTVFIAALVHNLIHGGRLPLFKSYASGRVSGAALAPQPDDAVPRFDYEKHVRDLVDERIWPDSTSRISELRLTIRYESAAFFTRLIGSGDSKTRRSLHENFPTSALAVIAFERPWVALEPLSGKLVAFLTP